MQTLREIHDRIEKALEAWGHLVVRWRRSVTVLMLLLSAICISQVPNLRADNSTESFLRKDDLARTDYDAFREQFGQDEQMVIAVVPPKVFDLAFLERLRAFHEAIEAEVPYLEEVTSLWNARSTRGEGDELIVEDLMEDWPETPADVARLEARVLETPLYLNTLINKDATITTVTVKPLIYSTVGDGSDALAGFDEELESGGEAGETVRPDFLTEEESIEQVTALVELVERFDAPDFDLHVAGGPVGNRHATAMMMRDVRVFLSGGVVVNAVILFALFRRVSGVVLPLLVILLALTVTFGVMAMLDIPTSVSGQVLPVLLLVVGICSSVHILTIVYQRLAVGESREDAIASALGHSGLAVLMATLTTAGGLLSFAAAPLAQVGNLGLIAPIGIVLTFIYSMTLLPSLLALSPLKPRPTLGADQFQKAMGRQLARLGDFCCRRPWTVLAAWGAVVVVGSFGIAQLRFSQNGFDWFPADDPVRVALDFMDLNLRGVSTLEVVIDTGEENGLYDPELLRRIDEASAWAETVDQGEIFIGKAFSIVDVVKETHKALNENRHEFYAIPDDRQLVAQELLLFENSGSDDLEELTDSQFSKARVSLRLPIADAMLYPEFIAGIAERFREILGDRVSVEVTGLAVLFGRTFSVVNVTMAQSYGIALVIITPLMILLIGNLRRGLLAMIPNLIPIALVLALMGFLDIPLDNSSLLVGCVIIGLAVDDTIHFMHKFQRYFSQTGDAREAVRLTLETTGAALMFTSIVLAAGFAVQMLSYMLNIIQFGMLATFAAIVAFLADMMISPALMVLVTRRQEGGAVEMPVRSPVAGG